MKSGREVEILRAHSSSESSNSNFVTTTQNCLRETEMKPACIGVVFLTFSLTGAANGYSVRDHGSFLNENNPLLLAFVPDRTSGRQGKP